jgi:hypothetical protein
MGVKSREPAGRRRSGVQAQVKVNYPTLATEARNLRLEADANVGGFVEVDAFDEADPTGIQGHDD